MAIAIVDSSPFTLLDSATRVSITINDDTQDPPVPIDPTKLYFKMMDIGGSAIIEDIWPSPATRIVKASTGKFYVDIGPNRAELNGIHTVGSSVLNIVNAYPLDGADWVSNGLMHIDIGGRRENIRYSSVNITAGTGTITLISPTTVQHAAGVPVIGENKETRSLGTFLFDWQYEMSVGGAITDAVAQVKVISPKTTMFLPDFRQVIDKSRKFVAPQSDCFLGYTDTQLLGYLEGGLTTINAYQPSLIFTFENFPLEYKQVLLDAGLITGVMSQQLYAIDTDIPSYSDSGVTFSFSHQPALASFLSQLTARLDRLIPSMKLQLINTGFVHTQIGPDYRLNTLVSSAPSGSLFRNVYFK